MRSLTLGILVAVGSFGLSAMAHDGSDDLLSGPILNPANNHTYFLLNADTWANSQVQALSLGGNLVTINDAAENAWVVTTFLNYGGISRSLWTGLNDAETEGTFQWVSGEAFTYSNWLPGQPDNGGRRTEHFSFDFRKRDGADYHGGHHASEDYVQITSGAAKEYLSRWTYGKWDDTMGNARRTFGVVEVVPVAVPEPAANILFVASGAVVVWLRRRNVKVPA
jgi:hypothetical protein